MDVIINIWIVIKAMGSWIDHQNWWILGPAMIGYLNVVAAGTRVMGWNHISNFCGKLEEAIGAMVQAWINRKQTQEQFVNKSKIRVDNFGTGDVPKNKQGASELNFILLLGCFVIAGCAFSRTMNVHISGNNIRSPYGSGDADIFYNSTTSFGGCHGNSEVAGVGE